MVNKTVRCSMEVMGRKRDAGQRRETQREWESRASSCQGIDVSLQLSSVTSATKSPSNCSAVPKHLANAQLMSTDAVSHWRLISSLSWSASQRGWERQNKRERKGRRRRKRRREMATCNIMRIIAPISPRVGVRPRVINSTACDWAQQCLCFSVYPTHQFNYDS